jgi:hypothetical protein
MKIVYVCSIAAYAIDGVNNKITTQVAAWGDLGHDVTLLCLSPSPGDATIRPLAGVPGLVFPFDALPGRLRATFALAREARRLKPDIVYMRYDLFLPPLAPCLWPLPVVLEINTDDRRETRLDGRLNGLYNDLTRGLTFRCAAGLVSVTNELARAPGLARYDKPTVVIANGADPDAVEPLPASAPNGRRLSAVILVGYIAPWIGAHKLKTLARALPGLDVHVVGDVGDTFAGMSLPPNLILHGRLPRDEYRDILSRSDFGIGPLALHRLGLTESSSLKVREYLLHGLPVLLANDDTDFLGETPWYLMQIPNAEDNIATSSAAIESWARTLEGRRVPREAVVDRIGVRGKERARLSFMQAVVDRRTAARAAAQRA